MTLSIADLYLRVRDREGRLYPDAIVARLPEVPTDDPLRSEWHARDLSHRRLLRHVGGLARPVRILEVGCGNGWLAHRLSELPGVEVWGLDLLGSELMQAERLFHQANVAFISADVFRAPFCTGVFDIVVVASAIQYFPDLQTLISSLRELLSPRGELHILDSPLYHERDLPAARSRTQAYYSGLGFPEMAKHYFHHTFRELEPFGPHFLYRPQAYPARVARLLRRSDSPFPWLCIHH